MLGSKQLAKFKKAVAKSNATFKVIFNEVPIQQYYALPYDRWEGYEAERQALLSYLRDNVKNVVFLTTDVHANLVNDARFCTLGDGCPQNSGILDVTTGPVATATYSEEISGTLGNPSGGAADPRRLLQAAASKRRRHAVRGHATSSATPRSRSRRAGLTVDLLDANDQPVRDTGDSRDGRRRHARPAEQTAAPEAVGCAGANRSALSRASTSAPGTTRASTSRRRAPAAGQGLWLRHTVHKRPGEELTAARSG